MKQSKGITLIALVITIIIMLILVGATITIITQGGLINRAHNAVVDTDTAQKNETNRMNELGAEIDVAVGAGTEYVEIEYNKPYKLYIKDSPPKISQLNSNAEIETTISFNNLQIYCRRETRPLSPLETPVTISLTQPENPSQGDIWFEHDSNIYENRDGQIYEYTSGNWVANNNIIKYNSKNDTTPTNPTIGSLYLDIQDTEMLTYTGLIVPEYIQFIVTNGDSQNYYMYVHGTQEQADILKTLFEVTGDVKPGWNTIDINTGNVINILYSQIPQGISARYFNESEGSSGSEEDFNSIKQYISSYVNAIPE